MNSLVWSFSSTIESLLLSSYCESAGQNMTGVERDKPEQFPSTSKRESTRRESLVSLCWGQQTSRLESKSPGCRHVSADKDVRRKLELSSSLCAAVCDLFFLLAMLRVMSSMCIGKNMNCLITTARRRREWGSSTDNDIVSLGKREKYVIFIQ